MEKQQDEQEWIKLRDEALKNMGDSTNHIELYRNRFIVLLCDNALSNLRLFNLLKKEE